MKARPYRNALVVLTLVLPAFFCTGAKSVDRIKNTFEESAQFRRNRDCGWVAYVGDASYAECRKRAGGNNPFPFASVIYMRQPRRAWKNDSAGEPIRALESWMQQGRYVAFRIYAGDTTQLTQDTLSEVKTIGPQENHIAYWDPAYIRDHRKLVNKIGERWADSPRLAFVDIGGVGDAKGSWRLSPRRFYERAGLTDKKYLNLVKTFVRIYEKAFPGVQLFISYECIPAAGDRADEVMAFLKEKGVGVRDDGSGNSPYPKKQPALRKWPVPLFWRDVPVLFEGSGSACGVYGWKQAGHVPQDVLTWAVQMCRPSYVPLGGSATASARACSDMNSFLIRNRRLLGYRFVLRRGSTRSEVDSGQQLPVRMKWVNEGRTPCYRSYRIKVAFCGPHGDVAASVREVPSPPTTHWNPGEEVSAKCTVTVPPDLPTGTYTVKIRLITASSATVRTAARGGDGKGRYRVGSIHIR